MSDVGTLPKLCHKCGREVPSSEAWAYTRDGVFDSYRARCPRCKLAERIASREIEHVRLLWELNDLYRQQALLLTPDLEAIP